MRHRLYQFAILKQVQDDGTAMRLHVLNHLQYSPNKKPRGLGGV